MIDADSTSLPWLDFVAEGGQSRVFGTATWVVKIPRWTWRTVLGRVLVHPATPERALEVLGGLVEPFVLLERVVFRGPCDAGLRRVWKGRWAVAGARLPAGDFLDRRMAEATPGEAADLMSALLDTLDAIRARGWHVLDFIMSNFVVGSGGRVRLVDAGLLVPVAHLRGPSHQICSRLFVSRLVADYRGVLAEVEARHPADAAGRRRLRALADGLGARLADWRAGRVRRVDEGTAGEPAATPFALASDIFGMLAQPGHKLPLTPRPPTGYTARHHAITSEN